MKRKAPASAASVSLTTTEVAAPNPGSDSAVLIRLWHNPLLLAEQKLSPSRGVQ